MTSGIGHPSFYPGLSVTTTSTSSSPAEKAGIKINDVILKINGRDIVGSESAISEFIGTIRTNANKEIILEVLRNPDSRTTKDLEGSKLDGVYTAKIDRIALVPVEGTRLIPDFAFASAAVTTSAPASASSMLYMCFLYCCHDDCHDYYHQHPIFSHDTTLSVL